MITNDDMIPGQPADQESLGQLFSEVFDLIDETVTRITADEVEDRLRRVLGQSNQGESTEAALRLHAESCLQAGAEAHRDRR